MLLSPFPRAGCYYPGVLKRDQIEELLYGKPNEERRFTQDFPILPDVWIAYAANPGRRVSLLLTPHHRSDAASMAQALRGRMAAGEDGPRLIYNESVALADLSFGEMLRLALPLTDWWAGMPDGPDLASPRLRRFVEVVGAIALARKKGREQPVRDWRALLRAVQSLLAGVPAAQAGLLWSINCNRKALPSIHKSRLTVKADAASRLFETQAAGIRWAVLDTGIDARHPAFQNRVTHTYDFLRIQELLDPGAAGDRALKKIIAARPKEAARLRELRDDLRRSLQRGRAVDWDLLEPFLRIPHDDTYEPPKDSHGTHVAGIVAANWPEQKMYGMCPEIELYDIRVLGKDSDEFTIMAALQFIRHLNAHKDVMVIHGVNLSLSVPHDVANFACGRTPICEECERVVASGVVVVTAAGNRGFNELAYADDGGFGDYRYISITDPGNADGVITVGSTHRVAPHTYGVSYFSSRGPTGDGRTKPDLVAPGERIDSCASGGGCETMDGTSMAAPHVSGAAALLLSRHRELIGQPRRVKEILVRSATDLGREPRFQGGGNLDVLRALQSV
jgi:serine protease AprX